MFLLIIIFMFAGNALWWQWADGRAKNLRHRRAWRVGLAAFMLYQLAYLAYFLLAPVAARRSHQWVPAPVVASVYIWPLLILPLAFLTITLAAIATTLARLLRGWRTRQSA